MRPNTAKTFFHGCLGPGDSPRIGVACACRPCLKPLFFGVPASYLGQVLATVTAASQKRLRNKTRQTKQNKIGREIN